MTQKFNNTQSYDEKVFIQRLVFCPVINASYINENKLKTFKISIYIFLIVLFSQNQNMGLIANN